MPVVKAPRKELESVNACKGVYVIGTINRLDLIDLVKCSLGRFRKTFFRDLPNGNGKLQILKVITKKTIFTNLDLCTIAEDPWCIDLRSVFLNSSAKIIPCVLCAPCV